MIVGVGVGVIMRVLVGHCDRFVCSDTDASRSRLIKR